MTFYRNVTSIAEGSLSPAQDDAELMTASAAVRRQAHYKRSLSANRFCWLSRAVRYILHKRSSVPRGRASTAAQRVIVERRGWRILPLKSYDLRFPVVAHQRIMTRPATSTGPFALQRAGIADGPRD